MEELTGVKIKYHPRDFLSKKELLAKGPNCSSYESKTNKGYVDENTIDKKILNLVKAVNYLGIETLMSCQGGHETYAVPCWVYPNTSDRRPWVNWKITKKRGPKIKKLKDLIRKYNALNKIRWIILKQHEVMTLSTKKPIKKIKNEANDLAEFLFKESKDIY